ncbi:hypothetical protein GCK32_021953, partial [Trichostrongylus colubriformis]
SNEMPKHLRSRLNCETGWRSSHNFLNLLSFEIGLQRHCTA